MGEIQRTTKKFGLRVEVTAQIQVAQVDAEPLGKSSNKFPSIITVDLEIAKQRGVEIHCLQRTTNSVGNETPDFLVHVVTYRETKQPNHRDSCAFPLPDGR
jgi:hypothetical protein